MISRSLILSTLLVVLAALLLDNSQVEARYLPTRANGDRLDKLHELLKEMNEVYRLSKNEIEKEEMEDVPRWHSESKLFYKREADPAQPLPN